MEVITSLCVGRKITHEGHVRSAQITHGETSWWEDNEGFVGEDFLLA
jgi:hypothetical protein